MIQFEIEIMVVRIGSEPDLLYNDLGGLRLHFFLFPLQFIKELLIINHPANRRVCCGRDLNKVKSPDFCDGQCFAQVINPRLYIFPYNANNGRFDVFIDLVRVLFLYERPAASPVKIAVKRKCYGSFSYV